MLYVNTALISNYLRRCVTLASATANACSAEKGY